MEHPSNSERCGNKPGALQSEFQPILSRRVRHTSPSTTMTASQRPPTSHDHTGYTHKSTVPGQVGPTQTNATPPKRGQIRPAFSTGTRTTPRSPPGACRPSPATTRRVELDVRLERRSHPLPAHQPLNSPARWCQIRPASRCQIKPSNSPTPGAERAHHPEARRAIWSLTDFTAIRTSFSASGSELRRAFRVPNTTTLPSTRLSSNRSLTPLAIPVTPCPTEADEISSHA